MAPPKTEHGKECSRCGSNERYVRSGQCAPCMRAQSLYRSRRDPNVQIPRALYQRAVALAKGRTVTGARGQVREMTPRMLIRLALDRGLSELEGCE